MAKILTLTLNPALDITVSLDTLRPGHVNRSHSQHSHAAGKGLNVAQVLADLGHSVTVGGFLGRDNIEPFEALIAWRGFADCFVRVPGETRSNIKLVEADGRVTDINGQGPEVDEAARVALLRRLEQVAAGHDAVVVAGSLPRGVDAQWFHQLLLQLKQQGLKIALDTSGEALRVGLQVGPWLVKPNTEELGEALGAKVDTAQAQRLAAERLLASGVEHVVVSQGEQGLSWFAQDRPPCMGDRRRCRWQALSAPVIRWSRAWSMACCWMSRASTRYAGPRPSPLRRSLRSALGFAIANSWRAWKTLCN